MAKAKSRVLAFVGVKAKEGELVYYKDGKLMAVKANRGGKKGRKVCGVSKPKPKPKPKTKKAAPKKAAKKVTTKKPVTKKRVVKKTAKKKAATKKTTTKNSKQLTLFSR